MKILDVYCNELTEVGKEGSIFAIKTDEELKKNDVLSSGDIKIFVIKHAAGKWYECKIFSSNITLSYHENDLLENTFVVN